eukprot:5551646-Pyramimonas_sp.AAC.1
MQRDNEGTFLTLRVSPLAHDGPTRITYPPSLLMTRRFFLYVAGPAAAAARFAVGAAAGAFALGGAAGAGAAPGAAGVAGAADGVAAGADGVAAA